MGGGTSGYPPASANNVGSYGSGGGGSALDAADHGWRNDWLNNIRHLVRQRDEGVASVGSSSHPIESIVQPLHIGQPLRRKRRLHGVGIGLIGEPSPEDTAAALAAQQAAVEGQQFDRSARAPRAPKATGGGRGRGGGRGGRGGAAALAAAQAAEDDIFAGAMGPSRRARKRAARVEPDGVDAAAAGGDVWQKMILLFCVISSCEINNARPARDRASSQNTRSLAPFSPHTSGLHRRLHAALRARREHVATRPFSRSSESKPSRTRMCVNLLDEFELGSSDIG